MRKKLLLTLLATFLTAVGGIWYTEKNLKVEVEIPPSAKLLSAQETLDLKVKTNYELPIGTMEVYLTQKGKKLELYKGKIANTEEKLLLKPKEAGFTDGEALLVAVVKFPLLGERELFKEKLKVDLTPPQIEVLHKPRRLIVGEPGVLEVKVSEPVSFIYLQLGEAKFPLLPNGKGEYTTIFTAPLFLLKEPERYFIVAQDLAGNKVEKFLPVVVKLKKFRTERFYLKKETLERLVLKFFDNPDNLVEKFKIINERFRKEDEERLIKLSSLSENSFHPYGRFLQLPGSKPTAYYGDHRFYYYEGHLISEAYHKGLDLAKYRHAPVVAANDGKVIFTGRLKIYGNVILIDHGYGLITLYAHLNDFAVKEGQYVKKGEVIGHTDSTGLALGDHLHFGVLVWGYATNPIFYFDRRYLNYYLYPYFRKSGNE